MRVGVRASLGSMTQLRLHGFDRVAVGDRLARNRVAAKRVVAQRSKPKCFLHCKHRPLVAVDVARKGPVLAEQELGDPKAAIQKRLDRLHVK